MCNRAQFVALLLLPLGFICSVSALAQQNLQLSETRVPDKKASLFMPASTTEPSGIAALRKTGAFYWAVTPVIAETWDKQTKDLGLMMRVTGNTALPTAVVFMVDGKPTMISSPQWQDAPGGRAVLLEKPDLVRDIAAAEKLSITMFGSEPVTADFKADDLVFIRTMLAMYNAGTFESAVSSKVDAATTPAEQAASTASQAIAPPVIAPASTPLGPSTPAAAGPPAVPNGKVDRKDYLASKVEDVAKMCHEQIVATAKDPTSLQFADKYSYAFGRALTRNWIFITWDIMGRNTYGAVLKHEMTCTFSCPPGKACSFINLQDQ